MSVRELVARPLTRAQAATWRFPALVSIAALTITAIPYLVGNLFAHGDQQFMGIASDVPDTTQYFAWMHAFAHADRLVIANPLTPEPNQAVYFNLLWFALGHIGRLAHLPPVVIYQGFRWAAGAGFLAALWVACGVFCTPGWEQRLAWLLAALGGGFGWIWVVLKYVLHHPVPPLDVYIAEPNTVFALIAFPHLLFASSLIIGIFLLFLYGNERDGWAAYGGAAVLGLLLGVTHAYDLIIVFAVLGVYSLVIMLRRRMIPWRVICGAAIIGGVSSPPALYFTYLTQHDSTWRGVLAQYTNGGIVTPTPLHLAILLGPVFLVALLAVLVPGGWAMLRSGPERHLLPVIWFLVSFPLVYVPTSYQIKMLNGWQIPAGILAARGLLRVIAPRFSAERWRFNGLNAHIPTEAIVGVALLALALPTNLYLIGWRSDELHRAARPYSLTRSDLDALHWLESHATDGDVVLSSQTVGQYVAGMSDARPVLAHWAQTLRYYEKETAVRHFYTAATTNDERAALIQQWNVRYVLWGPEERALGAFNPEQHAGYIPVFVSGQTTIYAFRPIVGQQPPGKDRAGPNHPF